MNALLLAAGFGSRFKPHSLKVPKPAIPTLNIPMMAYSIFALEQLGIERLVVNTHHLPEEVKKAAKKVTANVEYPVEFSEEKGEILDSGGGIHFAEEKLGGSRNFAIANADSTILFTNPQVFSDLRSFHESNEALLTILTIDHPDAGGRLGGIWCDNEGQVASIGKTKPGDGYFPHHYIGMMIFSDRIFSFLPEGKSNIFLDAVNPAIETGEKVLSLNTKQINWREMESPDDFVGGTKELLDILNDKKSPYHSCLKTLFRRFNSEAKVSIGSVIGKGATLGANSSVSGYLVLGENAQVGENCELENVTIGPGVKIEPGTKLKNTLVLT